MLSSREGCACRALCECWEVFQAAAIADGLASQATLAMYSAEFKSRVRDFGAGCWQLCVEADVIARSEQFVAEHAKQLPKVLPILTGIIRNYKSKHDQEPRKEDFATMLKMARDELQVWRHL